MKKAFRYDGSHMDEQIDQWEDQENSAIRFLRKYLNVSVTENGAAGYRTTQHPLLDLNFMVSALRDRSESDIAEKFHEAYTDSPKYAVKWLFFLRDILEGLGERRSFRVCMQYLALVHPKEAAAVMELIPEYGRYDDLLVFLDTPLQEQTIAFLKRRLDEELQAEKEGRAISLLAKWLPSINTSSRKTRAYAYKLAKGFGMDERTYRKTLSKLRAYGNVLEAKISASQWDQVDYAAVPAKANLKYESAFSRHDLERRTAYLKQVLDGNEKLNIKGLMPHEIVHRLMQGNAVFTHGLKDELLAELMWKKMVHEGFQNEWGLEDCIVVADGSGSMYSQIQGTSVLAIEVCNALAIYFAEQLQGVLHNKAITFSERPQFIEMDHAKNLKEKLNIMLRHTEVANTNIEAVFQLLLDMAVSNEVPKEELPKQVLIISDMEFDVATRPWYDYGKKPYKPADQKLFDDLKGRYEEQGYQMPRLIFWNVCGRTDTIPMVDNEEGLCLLSGFSQNAMKIAADREKKDPYECLIQVLDRPRYEKVEQAWANAHPA